MQWYGWISHMTCGTLYVTCLAESGFLIKASRLQNYLLQQVETSEYCCLNVMQFVGWISYQPSFYLVLDYPGYTFSTTFTSVPKDSNTIPTHVITLSQKHMETLRVQLPPFCLLLLVEFAVLNSYDGRMWGGRLFSEPMLLGSDHPSFLGYSWTGALLVKISIPGQQGAWDFSANLKSLATLC